MTEYIAAGLFFLTLIVITTVIYFAYYSVCKRRYRRKVNKLMKVCDRMKKVENYAIFVALSEAYKE